MKVPDGGLDRLRRAGVAIDASDRSTAMPRAELVERIAPCDGLISMLADRIDAEVMDAAPALRGIANFAVGLDNIDVPAATARGIVVTNTPGVLTEATAELAWALILAAGRRVVEGDRLVRTGRLEGWAPTLLRGMELSGGTLGIVGAGRIGTAAGLKAKAFGMHVLYFNRSASAALDADGARHVDLDELLRESDVVSVHLPLSDGTRHLIGARQLALMKPTAILVNTGRGAVLDEAALVEALRERRIAAAGLDVYEHEPALAPGLAELDNVVLLPHVGSATYTARDAMVMMTAESLLAVFDGHRPEHCVNPEVFEQGRRD
ncbi:MAG: D-glycerate dehydrogenase [Verrucomicrobia bacterium]|nr:D-glycerate dehydrogenase [Verrucomicrobiota bacterium]